MADLTRMRYMGPCQNIDVSQINRLMGGRCENLGDTNSHGEIDTREFVVTQPDL